MSDTLETQSTFRVIEAEMVAWAKGEIYTEDVVAVMKQAETSVSDLERQRDAYAETLRAILWRNQPQVAQLIRERHPELAHAAIDQFTP